MKTAVIGAGGFVGGHVLRVLRESGIDARAVVRDRLAFAGDADRRIGDARSVYAMRAALEGCECVVHSIVGPPDVILGTLAPVYAAAQAVGARRIVYMSTGSVHGQTPPPGTTEASTLTIFHASPYNTAKVRAERALRRLRERGTVEIVMLRPTIVVGPRSRWVFDFAAAALDDTPYLVDGGSGTCNSIYVDNLAHAVRLALTAPGVDGEAFLVGDTETVTWADLYRPIASAIGVPFDRIRNFSPPALAPGVRARYVEPIRTSAAAQLAIAAVPRNLKTLARTVLRGRPSTAHGARPVRLVPEARAARPTDELIALQRCAWRLPNDKAVRLLAYKPPVSFAEGCRRSIEWLLSEWLPQRRVRDAVANG